MAKKNKVIFDKGSLKALQYESKSRMGVSFTIKNIKDILIKDAAKSTEWLMNDLAGCYSESSDHYGMDTMPREVWFGMVGHHYTGRDWPINADSDEVSNKFFIDLKKAFKKAKLKHV